MTTKTSAAIDENHFAWLALNPLIQHLPQRLSMQECRLHLRHDPSRTWGGLPPPELQEEMANEVKRSFAPTDIAAKTVSALQNMLYTGLKHRDPRVPSNRRGLYETGALLGAELSKLPWFPTYAAGATVRGITGCGKSLCIERFLLPRFEQVHIHGKREDCGWLKFPQLVYLIVPMPADGSRGGLLLEIAMQMDAILGTDYVAQLRSRYKTVEKGLVAVLHWLSVHRCGLLVIEEAQERHSTAVVFGSDFVTFFLRVLNFGIPLVLVGNPLAFKNIDSFSQDVRRFSEGGKFEFDPVTDYRSTAWRDDLVPAIWGFNVFRTPDEPIDGLNQMLWGMTGGIPDALCRLRRVTLQTAALAGDQRVLKKHIEYAYESAVYAPMRPLIRAFVKKDPVLLKPFNDIPHAYFEEKWNAERAAEAERLAKAKLKAVAATLPPPPEPVKTASQDITSGHVGASPASAAIPEERKKRTRQRNSTSDPEDRRGAQFKKKLEGKQAALDATAAGTSAATQREQHKA